MKINTIGKLYHGTDINFESFDFKFAKRFKDFGAGFYLTSSLKQAQKWAQKKSDKKGIAYIYRYDVKEIPDTGMKILELLKYNKEWVDFTCKSRIEGLETDHDIIYDRMADSMYSDISEALQEYMDNEINAEQVVKRIKWKNPDADQYCFKSEKALSYLCNRQVFVQYKATYGKWIQESGR